MDKIVECIMEVMILPANAVYKINPYRHPKKIRSSKPYSRKNPKNIEGMDINTIDIKNTYALKSIPHQKPKRKHSHNAFLCPVKDG